MGLVLAWQLDAHALGEFTQKEFVDGMTKLCCESEDDLKARMDSLRALVAEPSQFKVFYQWVFEYGKGEKTAKALQLDMAVALWSVLLKDRFQLLPLWLQFVQEEFKKS